MAHWIVPFMEVLNIVVRDSYLEDDSSCDVGLHLSLHPGTEDSTTVPLKDIATISRAFGRLIPPWERDKVLELDESLAKDQVRFDGEHALESSENDAPGFSSSIVQEHSKSDEVSEIVGDCVSESNIEHDLVILLRMSSHQLSSTLALVSLNDA